MTELRSEDVLRKEKTNHPNSIISLTFPHKALSYISCLSDFKNLEKVDLSFNNLSSLKGLECCLNLKWLSVHHNKLITLKGIEALTNLNVLNASRNKLKSMDEVINLVNLCALILNDNQIASVSGLHQLIHLNTLVLSRNPICNFDISVANLKSIVKISLSSCQLEDIHNSIKACTGLEQLRLAHNNIKTLPAELAYSKKLQILDLGNNIISRWSDMEVLSSLHNLKNLNLFGNPIAEKVKLIKKVKRLVPSLQILNSKRIDNEDKCFKGKEKSSMKKEDVEHNEKVINKKEHQLGEKVDLLEKENNSRKVIKSLVTEGKTNVAHHHGEDEQKKQKKKKEKLVEISVRLQETGEPKKDESLKRKVEKAHLDVIDDKETPFAELVAYDATKGKKSNDGHRRDYTQAVGDCDAISALVTYPAKKKKSKNLCGGASILQFLTPEVGLGGASAWSDGEE